MRARLAALAALVVLTSTPAGATKAAEPPGWTTDGANPGRAGATAVGSNAAWSPDTD